MELHSEASVITAAIDIGKYYCHWVMIGWLNNAAGFVMDYGVLEVPGVSKTVDKKAVELAIFNALMSWRNEMIEAKHVPDLILVDSGAYTQTIYSFVKEVGGNPFIASKGTGDKLFRHGTPSDTRIVGQHWFGSFLSSERVWLYNLDTDHWKSWVHERFLTPTLDQNNRHRDGSLSIFVDDIDPRRHHSFSQHICAEVKCEIWEPGKGLKTYWDPVNRNNHWLDATYMACAAAAMMGIHIPLGDTRIKPKQETAKPQPRLLGPGGQPYLVTERN